MFGQTLSETELANSKSMITSMTEIESEKRPSAKQLLQEDSCTIKEKLDANYAVTRKCRLVEESHKAKQDRRFVDEMKYWKEVVELGLPLTEEEIRAVNIATTELPKLLNDEELRNCSSQSICDHATATIYVIDRVIGQAEIGMIQSFLVDRWNSSHNLLRRTSGSRSEIVMETVKLARESCGRFSLAHPKVIKKLRYWILHIEDFETRRKEFKKMLQDAQNALAEPNILSQPTRNRSELQLEELRQEVERLEEKERITQEAKMAAKEGRFLEQLKLYRKIFEWNMGITADDRSDMLKACNLLSVKTTAADYVSLPEEEKIEHCKLCTWLVDRLLQVNMFDKPGDRTVLLQRRWDHDKELREMNCGFEHLDAQVEWYISHIRQMFSKRFPWNSNREAIQLVVSFALKFSTLSRRKHELMKTQMEIEDSLTAFAFGHLNERIIGGVKIELERLKALLSGAPQEPIFNTKELEEAINKGDVNTVYNNLHIIFNSGDARLNAETRKKFEVISDLVEDDSDEGWKSNPKRRENVILEMGRFLKWITTCRNLPLGSISQLDELGVNYESQTQPAFRDSSASIRSKDESIPEHKFSGVILPSPAENNISSRLQSGEIFANGLTMQRDALMYPQYYMLREPKNASSEKNDETIDIQGFANPLLIQIMLAILMFLAGFGLACILFYWRGSQFNVDALKSFGDVIVADLKVIRDESVPIFNHVKNGIQQEIYEAQNMVIAQRHNGSAIFT